MKENSIIIDIDEQKRLISLINRCSSFDMFQYEKCAIDVFRYSFFENYVYVSAKCFSCIPVVTMGYLWDGKDDVIKMDGTRDCVFDNLYKLGLNVDDDNVADYMRFVLGHVFTEKGTLRLVQNIDDVEFSDIPSKEQRDFLEKNIRPVKAIRNNDGYDVDAMIIYFDSLFIAKIEMKNNGIFDIMSETLLCDGYTCLREIMLL